MSRTHGQWRLIVRQPTSKAKPSQVVLSLLVMGEVGRFMYVYSFYNDLSNLNSYSIAICHPSRRSSTRPLSILDLSKRKSGQRRLSQQAGRLACSLFLVF